MTTFKIEELANDDGSLSTQWKMLGIGYVQWDPHDVMVCIAGAFTAGNLRAIADWMDGHWEKAHSATAGQPNERVLPAGGLSMQGTSAPIF